MHHADPPATRLERHLPRQVARAAGISVMAAGSFAWLPANPQWASMATAMASSSLRPVRPSLLAGCRSRSARTVSALGPRVVPLRATGRLISSSRARALRPYATLAQGRASLRTRTAADADTGAAEHLSAPPARKSLLRRFLGVCVLGVVFTTAGFMASAVPALAAVQKMTNPPSDEETLSLFTPGDEAAARIDAFLRQHPLARRLRQDPAFVESRPHLKIPAELRAHSLSAGTLTGPGRIAVPPLTFAHRDGDAIYVLAHLGQDVSGHPGIVHGGCIATLLDEGFARCCFPKLPNRIGMTANLNINYKAPLPADSYVVLKATTTNVEGRKAWVEGTLETLHPDEEAGTVHAHGTALFIEPKQAAVSVPKSRVQKRPADVCCCRPWPGCIRSVREMQELACTATESH